MISKKRGDHAGVFLPRFDVAFNIINCHQTHRSAYISKVPALKHFITMLETKKGVSNP